ncbi:MAG: DEAD/DEAH box helicase [Treponema sp.]|nr:DEAD/DEAH box helicase [Treponema sp.]
MTDNFAQLGVSSFFIKRLEERNIIKPTDIQNKVSPLLAAGENILFTSATGTGKTFAYLLPVLSSLLSPSREAGINPYFVIVAPTLELCTQIKSELDFLLADTKISSSLLTGSVNLERQIETLKKEKTDIIVGNLGRLHVLAKMGKIKFSGLKYLVLDEADRLVSGEMMDETSELCKIIRREAKSGFTFAACSATLNKKCREKLLVNCFGSNTANIKFIEAKDSEILFDKIEHWAIFSEKRRKDQALRSLLSALKAKNKRKGSPKALIFTSRNDEALFVLSRLQHHHIPAAGLFGKVSKKPISGENRKAALDSFRDGTVMALVSTDLAARGLDIPDITHVIALDVPSDSEVYIHRCGRTGRAGKRGTMITIGDETQMFLLSALEKKLKIKIYPKELHYGQVCAPMPDED